MPVLTIKMLISDMFAKKCWRDGHSLQNSIVPRYAVVDKT